MARPTKPRPAPAPTKAKNLGGRPKKARTDPGLVLAIERAGSLGRIAEITGVTVGAVSLWSRVPKRAIDAIAAALNIRRHTLRPDLYDEADVRITKT